jgi:dUTP pyrophosphatase
LDVVPSDFTSYPTKFQRLHPDAKIPQRGSLSAAGYDLTAIYRCVLGPGRIAKIPLGFATEMHPDIHCRIESRSGMALKGLVVLTGVIDADYRGEWCVILMNVTEATQTIAPGDRVAQAVMRPTVRTHFTESKSLEDSQRGSGGFGSSGR